MKNVKFILMVGKSCEYTLLTFAENEIQALNFKKSHFVRNGYDFRLYEVIGLSISLIDSNFNSISNGGF